MSTMLFDLCDDENFTATSLVANGTFDEYVLSEEDFEALGPAMVDVVVHVEGTNFSSNFTYDVVLQYNAGVEVKFGPTDATSSNEASARRCLGADDLVTLDELRTRIDGIVGAANWILDDEDMARLEADFEDDGW